ncbi:hypothetical protein EV426DRAFT_274451 [Tirmania nivea]|nr:hypothetical protein EV426DRAFT_274451 [Tirmania nivea]
MLLLEGTGREKNTSETEYAIDNYNQLAYCAGNNFIVCIVSVFPILSFSGVFKWFICLSFYFIDLRQSQFAVYLGSFSFIISVGNNICKRERGTYSTSKFEI